MVCATVAEMLGDHGDVDKSKPWEGSAHVPLMCKGPGIVKGQTVTRPVATMDMAGTFLDFADAKPAAGMTTQSFRSLLEGNAEATDYRSYVSSGLNNFRAQHSSYPRCLLSLVHFLPPLFGPTCASLGWLRIWGACACRHGGAGASGQAVQVHLLHGPVSRPEPSPAPPAPPLPCPELTTDY